jgi:hypothetical protein
VPMGCHGERLARVPAVDHAQLRDLLLVGPRAWIEERVVEIEAAVGSCGWLRREFDAARVLRAGSVAIRMRSWWECAAGRPDRHLAPVEKREQRDSVTCRTYQAPTCTSPRDVVPAPPRFGSRSERVLPAAGASSRYSLRRYASSASRSSGRGCRSKFTPSVEATGGGAPGGAPATAGDRGAAGRGG